MTDQTPESPKNGPGGPQDGQKGGSGGQDNPQGGSGPENGDSGDSKNEPDRFPREYVESLRKESKSYREKAARVDALTQRLVNSMASANGKLADPTDLPITDALMGDDGFPDPAKVDEAIEDLIAKKPHLRSRKPDGDLGQGARETATSGSWLDPARQRI